jgi:hypothetical protein
MTTLPTWHGQPAALNDISGIDVEAFGMVFAAMRGKSWCNSTKDDALHLLEAGAHLGLMAYWADNIGVLRARDAGASWSELAAAMGGGVSSSTAKSRYKKASGS